MSNNKFKVLVVEDEANICSFIETLLETNGYQALVANTCSMGLTLFASHNPDLVILDLGLPDRDGLCLLYTSDAADEEDSGDLGGGRIIKKKKENEQESDRGYTYMKIIMLMPNLYIKADECSSRSIMDAVTI